MNCPTCGGVELSEYAKAHQFEDHFRFTRESTDAGASTLSLRPRKVRICLKCGYTMEFVDQGQIRQYRKWSAKAAMASDSAVKSPHPADLVSWSRAADMLELSLESDPDRCWKIEQRDSLTPWRLRYLKHALGWQTMLDLTLPGSFPQTCELRARAGREVAQRTGNPIVDAEVYVVGFTSAARLTADDAATEVLISAICGQGLRLSQGRITLQKDGLVADPMDLIRVATSLARLLVRAV